MADGRILIDSAIETAGLKKGTAQLEAACRSVANNVKDIGTKTQIAIAKSVNAISKQNSAYRQQEAAVADLKRQLDEMAGQHIETDAYKNTTKDVEELTAKLEALERKRSAYVRGGGTATGSSKEYNRMLIQATQVRAELDAALATKQRLEATGAATRSVDVSEMSAKLAQEQAKLALMSRELDISYASLQERVGAYGDSTSDAANDTVKLRKELSQVDGVVGSVANEIKRGISTSLKYGVGIRSLFVLFNRLRTAMKESYESMAQYDKGTAQSMSSLSAGLSSLENALASAFAPILTAAAPALVSLTNLLTQAANAVAMFFAALTGKSTYTKAVELQNDYADSLAATGGGAKSSLKYLTQLDELQTWSEESGGGGGGGSGGINTGLFEEAAVNLGTFATDLVTTIRDVLFKWDDLDAEDIAMKAIAGLSALLGGVTGFAIGGVPGAIVGTIAGLVIGLIIDTLTFDNDGKLSGAEIATMIAYALGALVGGVIGFSAGGVFGAAIGATVGIGLILAIQGIAFSQDQKLREAFEQTEFYQELQNINKEIEELSTINADLQLNLTKRSENINKLTGSFKDVQKLVDEIIELGEETDRTAAETAILQEKIALVDELTLGAVKIEYDELTGKIVQTEDEIYALIEAFKQQAIAAAYSENLTQAVRDQQIAYKNMREAEEARGEAFQAYLDKNNELLELQAQQQELYNAAIEATGTNAAEAEKLWEQYNAITKEVEAAQIANDAALETLWETVAAVDESKAAYEAISAEVDYWSESMDQFARKTTEELSDIDVSVNAHANIVEVVNSAAIPDITANARLTSYTDAIGKKSLTFSAILTGLTISSSLIKLVANAGGGILQNGKWQPIQGYASGGVVSADLFFANENGIPELVGRIGHNTAVMNNAQIVASVAAGVYQAVTAAFGRLSNYFAGIVQYMSGIPASIDRLAMSFPTFPTPMPVVVTGVIIPPKAQMQSAETQHLYDMLSEIRSMLGSGTGTQTSGGEQVVKFIAQLDGKTLFEEDIRQARLAQMTSGRNPYDLE